MTATVPPCQASPRRPCGFLSWGIVTFCDRSAHMRQTCFALGRHQLNKTLVRLRKGQRSRCLNPNIWDKFTLSMSNNSLLSPLPLFISLFIFKVRWGGGSSERQDELQHDKKKEKRRRKNTWASFLLPSASRKKENQSRLETASKL